MFSLRTLLLVVLFGASVATLCVHYEPWYEGPLLTIDTLGAKVSDDGTRVVSSDTQQSNVVRVLDLRTQTVAADIHLGGNPADFRLSPDGEVLFACIQESPDGARQNWTEVWTATRNPQLRFTSDWVLPLEHLRLSKDQQTLFCLSPAHEWDVATGKDRLNWPDVVLPTFSNDAAFFNSLMSIDSLEQFVSSLKSNMNAHPVISGDLTTLFTYVDRAPKAQLWNMQDRKKKAEFSIPSRQSTTDFFWAGLSAHGDIVAFLLADSGLQQTVAIYDMRSNSVTARLIQKWSNEPGILSESGKFYVRIPYTGDPFSFDSQFTIFDTETGAIHKQFFDRDFAIARDGSRAVTLKIDGSSSDAPSRIEIYNVNENELVKRLSAPRFDWQRLWCSTDGTMVAFSEASDKKRVFFRRRPEQWWGIIVLPEFWLTTVLTFLAIWSIRRDGVSYKNVRVSGPSAPAPPQ